MLLTRERKQCGCERETLTNCLLYVPQWEIGPTTFWCVGHCSYQLRCPSRAKPVFFFLLIIIHCPRKCLHLEVCTTSTFILLGRWLLLSPESCHACVLRDTEPWRRTYRWACEIRPLPQIQCRSNPMIWQPCLWASIGVFSPTQLILSQSFSLFQNGQSW